MFLGMLLALCPARPSEKDLFHLAPERSKTRLKQNARNPKTQIAFPGAGDGVSPKSLLYWLLPPEKLGAI